MPLTEATQVSRGLIPAAPIKALVERWYAQNEDHSKTDSVLLSNRAKAAFVTGLSPDIFTQLLGDHQDLISFDTADRIVIRLSDDGVGGWRSNPELKEIYESFDLKALDRRKPTCEEAA